MGLFLNILSDQTTPTEKNLNSEPAETSVTASAPAPSSDEKLGPVLQFMRLMWGLDHSLNSASKRMELRVGITGTQRLVLRLVGQFPGIGAGEMANLLHLHPSTLTGVMQRLEAKNILRRLPDATDKRRARFELTKAGVRLCEDKSGTVEEAVERALQRIDPKTIAGIESTVGAIVTEIDAQEIAVDPTVKKRTRRKPTRRRKTTQH
jgi:DNA-binding MarR family transcriptional regulator